MSESKEEQSPSPQRPHLDYGSLPILVTGGTGYIGSHMVIELIETGFTNIVIIDNFSNSSPLALKRIKTILSQEGITSYSLITYKINLAEDKSKLFRICRKHQFFACLHFAGLKAIGESVINPLKYYRNNLNSILNLLNCLQSNNCYNLIFSSSASVYGTSAIQDNHPVTEQSEVCHGIINSYGWTKAFAEQILINNAQSNPLVNCVILRYFNPIGAHKSGLIGEDPRGMPNNLMPYLLQVAVGRRKQLHIFGSDYNTIDGTGVRDYIHVMDLAKGHVLALEKDIIPKWLSKQTEYLNEVYGENKKFTKIMKKHMYYNYDNTTYHWDNNISIFNLGTGKGTSVLEMLHALEKACGHKIPYILENRRPGDVDSVFADCSLVYKKIGFKAIYNVEKACEDSWRWQKMNPMGYGKKAKPKDVLEELLVSKNDNDEADKDDNLDELDGYDGNDVFSDVEDDKMDIGPYSYSIPDSIYENFLSDDSKEDGDNNNNNKNNSDERDDDDDDNDDGKDSSQLNRNNENKNETNVESKNDNNNKKKKKNNENNVKNEKKRNLNLILYSIFIIFCMLLVVAGAAIIIFPNETNETFINFKQNVEKIVKHYQFQQTKRTN